MVPLKRHKDPYLYLISTVIYTGARVAKPGQRRQVQGRMTELRALRNVDIDATKILQKKERGSPSQVKGASFRG